MSVPNEPAFSRAEYRRRLEATWEEMSQRHLDALLLFSPGNIYYLAGMDTENWVDLQCLVIPLRADPALIILNFELGRCQNSSWLSSPVIYGPYDDPLDTIFAVLRERKLTDQRLGIEQRNGWLSLHNFVRLRSGLPKASLEDAFGAVERVRLVKADEEIALMRRAAALTDIGVAAGYRAIAPGSPDSEVAGAIVNAMYRGGSDPVCWGPIVAAGYRSGVAHSTHNGYVLKPGDAVFLEVTGEFRRYTAPSMRTAVIGSPSDEQRRLAQASQDAIAAILETARAGVPASEVAQAGLKHIHPVEREIVFHYIFGYPVGIGYPPTWIEPLGYLLRADNHEPLQAGMVFHLPMSLRSLGRFGICLSQTMHVTAGGAVPLTQTPARLEEV
jgi:Xaa-Pro dipeptidase